jgi:hypothetical protein
MTGDMSGVLTRQRKLHFVPERADGPSLSFNFIIMWYTKLLDYMVPFRWRGFTNANTQKSGIQPQSQHNNYNKNDILFV